MSLSVRNLRKNQTTSLASGAHSKLVLVRALSVRHDVFLPVTFSPSFFLLLLVQPTVLTRANLILGGSTREGDAKFSRKIARVAFDTLAKATQRETSLRRRRRGFESRAARDPTKKI